MSASFDLALQLACYSGNLPSVERWLAAGANINSTTSAGSPLSIACERGKYDVARYLVEHGANINVTVERGYECDLVFLASPPFKQQIFIKTR